MAPKVEEPPSPDRSMVPAMSSIRDRTSLRLKHAMKARDRDAIAVCRRVLAAFSNAEAVPTTAKAGAVEAAASPGSAETEVARAVVTEGTMLALAAKELQELEQAADDATRHGADDAAETMRVQAAVVVELLVRSES